LLHDWPDSYFKAQQSKGDGLAGIFKQAMGQHQIQKVTRTRSVLARLFPASQFAKLLGAEVSISCHTQSITCWLYIKNDVVT